MFAELVNEHLAEVTSHPEVYANPKALSGLRSSEEVSLGERLSVSALGILEERLPRDIGPFAPVPS